ncbi:MAG: hypothetical protein JWM53_3024 [bacterium]|nr:hypothetical protein [bacterium]
MTSALSTRAVLVVSGLGIAAAAASVLGRRHDRGAGETARAFGLGTTAPRQIRNTDRATAAGRACCASCATGRNADGRSSWRSPLGGDRRWARWVRDLNGRNGVYLIRPAGGGDVLYIGESHRGRLMKTLTRHLWQWNGRGSGPTYDPRRVEIAVELFDEPRAAVERQFELIRQLEPLDNVQDGHSLALLDEVPF